MTRDELIYLVAEQLKDVPKKAVERVIKRTFDTISTELAHGLEVRIYGFGNFDVQVRSARKGRNPQTGETMDIPEKKAVRFKASKTLTDIVNA